MVPQTEQLPPECSRNNRSEAMERGKGWYDASGMTQTPVPSYLGQENPILGSARGDPEDWRHLPWLQQNSTAPVPQPQFLPPQGWRSQTPLFPFKIQLLYSPFLFPILYPVFYSLFLNPPFLFPILFPSLFPILFFPSPPFFPLNT